MDYKEPKLKNYYALKIKLKSLYILKNSFTKTSKFHLKVFYENEDENEVDHHNERSQFIDIPQDENFFMFKVNIKKKFYLPIICQNGQCPRFIHIIFTNDNNKKIGLKLYLNDYYIFVKHYGTYKAYKVFKHNSYDEKGRVELAIDLISCSNRFRFFGKKKDNMEPIDYFTLATKVSISKIKIEMLENKNDKDYSMHIESFPLLELLELSDTNKPNTHRLINLFKMPAKSSYEHMPIPLISAEELFDVICLEIFPYHRQNKQKPYWVKIANDAYDLFLYNHFRCFSKNSENHIYEEIKMCSLFFYLESIFVKIATVFAKSVIINEYTKFTSVRYANIKSLKKKSKDKSRHVDLFDNYFSYEKITGRNPLEVLKLFKDDEIYITNSTCIIKEGLIGIFIRGDEETNIDKAYKRYNSEIKAQQWLNKGIAKLKIANFREWKKKVEENICLEKIPLSCLSFNMSTIVSYKGFKMFVIPCPFFPLVNTNLNRVGGTLKYELKLLEKLIPTYQLFKQNNKNSPIFIQYHSQSNFVFYKVYAMMNKSKKEEFFFFDNSKTSSIGERKDDFFPWKSFYSNFFDGREDINLYVEEKRNEEKHTSSNKTIDAYLQQVVKEIESLSFHVPFDSVSLKTFLLSKGIRMRHIGKMLKFVTFKWLYTMICNEILIRCVKKFLVHSIREICLFYKRYAENRCNLFNEKVSNEMGGKHFAKEMNNLLHYEGASSRSSSSISSSTEATNGKIHKTFNTTINNNSDSDSSCEKNSLSSSSSENHSHSSEESCEDSEDANECKNNKMGNISAVYENRKNTKGNGLSSKKKALKSFLNISKILRDKLILENNLGCNFSLACELLNFEKFTKYGNTEMYRIKHTKNKEQHGYAFDIYKKEYIGNITVIDMFIINVFNLLLTDSYYKEMFLTTVVTNLCVKIFKIKNFTISLDLPYNYIYENLQKCVGISLFPCLAEYSKIKDSNRKFDIFHLKSYNCKIKRSFNIMYFDLEVYKYVHDVEKIQLNIGNRNKHILSHLIFLTIIHHHNLSMSNKATVERLLIHEKEIRDKNNEEREKERRNANEREEELNNRMYSKNYTDGYGQKIRSRRLKSKNVQNMLLDSAANFESNNMSRTYVNDTINKKDENIQSKGIPKYYHTNLYSQYNNFLEDIVKQETLNNNNNNTSNMNWIYGVKLNCLLTCKDNLTIYNTTDYLAFYSMLNVIGIGIKFHFFKTALRISNYVFRYISEDNIISIHFRLMWLAMYTCKKWTSKYFMKPSRENNNEDSYINFLYTEQSYKFDNSKTTSADSTTEYDNITKERYDVEKSTKQGDSTQISTNRNYDANADPSSTTNAAKLVHYFSIDVDYLTDEKNNDYFFYYGKIDVYKKTYNICSSILNEYFVYPHPLHLDFYLSLAWCNKCAKNYREFLFLLRTVILLQTNMRFKNGQEEKMGQVKLSDDFDSIIHSSDSGSNYSSRFEIKEPDKQSYFFLNDICYAHETTFLKDNIRLVPKTNSFYNIRLAYTLHYFANSLFYYYNTNKIINLYKSKEFILNGSLYCIKILENVKKIFHFFNAKNTNIAKVSIDVSLMVLKLIFANKPPEADTEKMMDYALSNVNIADDILRESYGINHVETLYCNYVLSLIYMYLKKKNCIYTFEEIIYYLLNYNYIYTDKNVVSEIFWYFPEHIVTSRCVNGKGFLDTDNIKCYLFNVYLNIFIPTHYLKKILKILLLLYYIDTFKNKNKINSFEKYSYLCDTRFYSYEKILAFLRGYKKILSKKDLLLYLEDYEELLKNNRSIRKNEKKIRAGKINKNALNKHVTNFFEYTDFVVYNSSKKKQNERNSLEDFCEAENSNNEDNLSSPNKNSKRKKYKSVTAQYLKRLIKHVEQLADYLYEEAKTKHEKKTYSFLQQSHFYDKIKKLNKIGMKNIPNILKKKKGKITLDNSTNDTISLFNSEESSVDSNYSNINSSSSINFSRDEERLHKNASSNITANYVSNTKWGVTIPYTSEKQNKLVYTDVDALITILYYFLNTATLENVYKI